METKREVAKRVHAEALEKIEADFWVEANAWMDAELAAMAKETTNETES